MSPPPTSSPSFASPSFASPPHPRLRLPPPSPSPPPPLVSPRQSARACRNTHPRSSMSENALMTMLVSGRRGRGRGDCY